MPERALGTMESCLRDIARDHTAFTEQYTLPDFIPDGVRPSLFGSSTIIDFVLMTNGYVLGDCAPQAVMLSGEKVGVSGLKINGNIYNLSGDSQSGVIKWGTGKDLKTIKEKNKNGFLIRLDIK